MERNRLVLSEIQAIAKEKSATPAQIALAWALTKGPEIIPIPGCKTRAHLEDILGAIEVELSPQEMQRLDRAYPPGVAAGGRYSAAQLAAWHQ